MQLRTVLIGLALSGLLASPAAVAESRPVAVETCMGGHGEDGLGTAPNFPVLAGQYADYLAFALKQYRSGERDNALMAPWAANLSDAEFADLAAYYAAMRGLVVPKR